MNIEAMQNLVRVLREVEEQKKPFDMEDWFADYDAIDDCATAACAAGWCYRDQWFKKNNFPDPSYSRSDLSIFFDIGGSDLSIFFDISGDESDRLFIPNFYIDGGELSSVIARAQEMIDEAICLPDLSQPDPEE